MPMILNHEPGREGGRARGPAFKEGLEECQSCGEVYYNPVSNALSLPPLPLLSLLPPLLFILRSSSVMWLQPQ